MYFIRRARLFKRKGQEEQCFICHKRSEGRLKTYESCCDARAWSLDEQERTKYVIEYMSCIARAEDKTSNDTNGHGKEKTLEGTSSQGKSKDTNGYGKEKTLEGTSSQGKSKDTNGYGKEKTLEGTSSQGKLSPSEYEEEYKSNTIKHGKKEKQFDGKTIGDPLDHIKQESPEESFLDDISESSLHGKKFARVAALGPNPARKGGHRTDEEWRVTSFGSDTFDGEHNEVSLDPSNIKREKKSDESVQKKKQFDGKTVGDPLDHIKQESFEESSLDDTSESSPHGKKFARVAALGPNPVRKCRCKTDEEWRVTSFERDTFDGERIKVSPNPANIKTEKKSDEAIKNENHSEDKTGGVSKGSHNKNFESSLHGEKFTQMAALRPNPASGCVCSTAKQLLTSYQRDTFDDDHNKVPANIKTEKKTDEAIQNENHSEDKTGGVSEGIHNENFESSLNGEKFTQMAALSPNPASGCGCRTAKQLLTSYQRDTFDGERNKVSPDPANIKTEKKSDEAIQNANHSEDKTGGVSEGIHNENFESSLNGEKFTQMAALRPNTPRDCMCNTSYQRDTFDGEHNEVSLEPENIKTEKKIDGAIQKENQSKGKTGGDETYLPLDHVKQESLEQSIVNDNFESSLHGEKFTQIAALRPHPDVITLPHDYLYDVVHESISGIKEEMGSHYKHEVPNEKETYTKQLTSSEGLKIHRKEVLPHKVERNLPSTMSSLKKQKEAATVQDKEVGSHSYENGSSYVEDRLTTCPKNCGMVEENPVSEESNSVEYISISRLPTITVSELERKSPANVPTPDAKITMVPLRQRKGYDNGKMDSSQNTEEYLSCDSENDSCKLRAHACREAKQGGSPSREEVDLPASARIYFLVPAPQEQRAGFSFSEKEVKSSGAAKQAGHMPKKDKSPIAVPAFEATNVPVSDIKKEEEIGLPYGEVNGSEYCNTDDTMDSSQYADEDELFERQSSFQKQHACACRDAMQVDSASKEEAALQGCGKVYFLVPVSQRQHTELNVLEQEGKSCGEEISSKKPVTDFIHFAEDVEFLDNDGNTHREESEKVTRSFNLERKFYKEQMDAAIRKLNDRMRETELLRAERDSLKTELDAAQNYIEHHKKAINKLNSMKKVDEQLSNENESLLKKIYQLSNTAYDQQSTISKLMIKLKQKSKHGSYTQNSISSGNDSGDFKSVRILFPSSEDNLMMPHQSLSLEPYTEYTMQNSTTDAASRYNMIEDNSYSFNNINGKSTFVEGTLNHLQITAITDHTPQNKNYLDLKNTIRREKDDLLKVTRLIQFQQGIISNLNNCINNEKIILSELNNTNKEKK